MLRRFLNQVLGTRGFSWSHPMRMGWRKHAYESTDPLFTRLGIIYGLLCLALIPFVWVWPGVFMPKDTTQWQLIRFIFVAGSGFLIGGISLVSESGMMDAYERYWPHTFSAALKLADKWFGKRVEPGHGDYEHYRALARKKLVATAREVLDAEKHREGDPMNDTHSKARQNFKDVHRTLQYLGLADPDWKLYFNEAEAG